MRTLATWLPLLAATGCAVELRVPDVRQSTVYTCGASALLAVLAYHGVEAREDELANALGTTPEDGAPPEAIVRVARERGLIAELREGMAIEDLERAIRGGHPVLVALQAWPDQPRVSFADDWDDGHYVVVVAIRSREIVFEDPSLLGSRGVLTRASFLERWHDADKDRRWTHMGIVFSGNIAPPPRTSPIE